jgi:tetratricopeptide (TPR) repeat protein
MPRAARQLAFADRARYLDSGDSLAIRNAIMKTLLGACVLLGAAPTLFAAPTLAEARQRLMAGNYEEARTAYEELAKDKDAAGKVPATLGLSKAYQSLGEYDLALVVVEDALKAAPKDDALLARRAEVLYLRGRWDDAEKAAEAALDATKQPDKGNFLARWVRAQIYRDRGELAKANEEYKWFVRTYSARDAKDDPIKNPDELLIVGLAGVENARGKKELAEQFSFVLDDVLGDALKYDKTFWPAAYQRGMLLLEKFNRGEALDEFDKALKLNPSAAEVLVGRGVAELQRFEGQTADSFADRALKVNPRLPEALRLKADVYLSGGDPAKALAELEKARKINPRDERTLARIAAAYHLQHKPADAEALAKQVEKFDKLPAVFWEELGDRLEDRRYFTEAKKCYEKAMDYRPLLPGPRCSLGMLYTRLGDEAKAGPLLDKGFEGDPFNVRVGNMRKVLRHLEKYETINTPHFKIRYAKSDQALAKYMALQLEGIYTDLSDKFKHKPAGPILVEVFDNHPMFSGRVVALPDLHTVGACTGRMFAMVSPNGRGVPKKFNWSRVLHHEMVHIFNLDQTNFLVPHWLTEGLAVSNEGFPRQPLWNQLLRERVPNGPLLDLDTIDLGFIRPRDGLQWQQAYCQAQLYVEYLREKYGKESISGLLAAYADGLDTAAALRKVCKVDKATFEKGYKEYLQSVVKDIGGKAPVKRKSLAQLKKDYDKDPSADNGAALAEALLNRDRVQARQLAEKALEAKKNHPKASLVLARLARLAGDVKQELKLLEAAWDRDKPDLDVADALGKLYYNAKEYGKAAGVFEAASKADESNPEWLSQLSRVYAQTNDKDRLIATLKKLVPTDADDLDRRKRLTRLLLEAKNFADAETYARQCLDIDVRDTDAREALLKALREQKKDDEAKKMEAIFEAK